jgi:hypothetical protein
VTPEVAQDVADGEIAVDRCHCHSATRVLAALIHLALAALAIAVVRSIVARQSERLRRLEATPTSRAS